MSDLLAGLDPPTNPDNWKSLRHVGSGYGVFPETEVVCLKRMTSLIERALM